MRPVFYFLAAFTYRKWHLVSWTTSSRWNQRTVNAEKRCCGKLASRLTLSSGCLNQYVIIILQQHKRSEELIIRELRLYYTEWVPIHPHACREIYVLNGFAHYCVLQSDMMCYSACVWLYKYVVYTRKQAKSKVNYLFLLHVYLCIQGEMEQPTKQKTLKSLYTYTSLYWKPI